MSISLFRKLNLFLHNKAVSPFRKNRNYVCIMWFLSFHLITTFLGELHHLRIWFVANIADKLGVRWEQSFSLILVEEQIRQASLQPGGVFLWFCLVCATTWAVMALKAESFMTEGSFWWEVSLQQVLSNYS